MSFKPLFIASSNTASLSIKSKRSQSALEYMMTYGWAILIIVIVAVILYSMGIFNPSSSVSSTVTGFSGLGSVTAECTANGVLRISVGDSTGNLINVTGITAKDPSITKTVNFKPNSTVDPNPLIRSGSSYIFSVPNICPSAGTHYAITVAVNYTEPGQVLPGPYQSLGSITGTSTSTVLPPFVASFSGSEVGGFGSSSFISTSANPVFNGTNVTFTLTAWVYIPSYPVISSASTSNAQGTPIFSFGPVPNQGIPNGNYFGANIAYPNAYPNAGYHGCGYPDVWWYSTPAAPSYLGQWVFVAYAISIPTFNFVFDSQNFTTSNTRTTGFSNQVRIGTQFFVCNGYAFNGYLSNIQLYHSLLSFNQINSLYKEGLMGAPLSGVDDWWPLNGSAKDMISGLVGTLNGPVQITSNFES